jgi:aquaporin Z
MMSDRPPTVGGHDAALRSFGRPNSVTRQFDFRDDGYEGRRVFAEVLGTFYA